MDFHIPIESLKDRHHGSYGDLMYKIVFHLLSKGSILPIRQMAKELLIDLDVLRHMLQMLQDEKPQLTVTLSVDFDENEVVLQINRVQYESYGFDILTPAEAVLTYTAVVWPAIKPA